MNTFDPDPPGDGDQLIACRDCGAEFLLTKPEQDFFIARELALPKRCKPCRAFRKGQAAVDAARALERRS